MGGARITSAQRDHYWSLRAQGWSIRRAAQEAGFSEASAKSFEKKRGNGADYHKAARQEAVPEFPIPIDNINDAARAAIDDRTGYLFCKRYFGWDLEPWQQQAWETKEDLWDSPDREFLLENAPPGGGKSSIAVAFACKRIAMDRGIRVLFISRAHSLAERNTMRVRRALERTQLAVNASSTLSSDFGRFRPRQGGDVWKRDEFVVEQMDGSPIEEKEPTVSAFGFDSEWLGNRIELVLGDDLDSTRSTRNMEIVEKNREVFDNELEPRLEPGGLFVVAQQRLGAFDFSAHCLSKRLLPEDDGSEQDVEGVSQYRHVMFKAHYEENCAHLTTPEQRKLHAFDAPSWPTGCLLAPKRLGWRDVRKAMNNPQRFKVVYQQEDAGEEDALVQRIWIEGGRGTDNVEYLGCWDNQRGIGQIPPNLSGHVLSVLTVDPSPANYWGIQWWIVHPDSEQRYLMDLHRAKMDAPEFLDWNPDFGKYTGLAEDWWQRSNDIKYPIQYLIFEMNAAQRFLTQYLHFQRWRILREVTLIAHSTHRNKASEDYGVSILGPRYRHGQVRLPGKGQEARLASLKLVEEVIRYPSVPTTDQVMAQWFMEHNLPALSVPEAADQTLRVPSWMKERRGYL